VALGATPTPAALAAAVVAARKLWKATVVGNHPVFHVPPSLVPDLIAANVLVSRAIDGEIAEVWGDTIVVGDGYETDVPRCFFTGSIDIHIAGPKDDSPVMYFRQNESVVAVDEVAIVDVPPCSIVRVGAYT
jgi:thioredoxin reductase